MLPRSPRPAPRGCQPAPAPRRLSTTKSGPSSPTSAVLGRAVVRRAADGAAPLDAGGGVGADRAGVFEEAPGIGLFRLTLRCDVHAGRAAGTEISEFEGDRAVVLGGLVVGEDDRADGAEPGGVVHHV